MTYLVSGRLRLVSRSLVLPTPKSVPTGTLERETLAPWDQRDLAVSWSSETAVVEEGRWSQKQVPMLCRVHTNVHPVCVFIASNRCIMEIGIATGHWIISFLEVVTNSPSH